MDVHALKDMEFRHWEETSEVTLPPVGVMEKVRQED
jgi:hypothetical protein